MFNKNRFFLSILPVFFLLLPLLVLPGCKSLPTQKITLKIWGIEPTENLTGIIASFNEQFPNTKIDYQQREAELLDEDLIQALALSRGPDIFVFKNTDLLRQADKIAPALPNIIKLKDFEKEFVDVCYQDLILDSNIYGLPLALDSLVLFYNKDLFNSAGLPGPPLYWQDFMNNVEKLTKKDSRGNILLAGVGLGVGENVNWAPDILSLLMMQTGNPMTDEYGNVNLAEPFFAAGEKYYSGAEAFRFYTDFSNPSKAVYSWNKRMPNALEAFATGQSAMYIGYNSDWDKIKSRAPYLRFEVSSIPQIKEQLVKVNYADYWAWTVSYQSKYPDQAWQFLRFLTNQESAWQYALANQTPVGRRDLVSAMQGSEALAAFGEQALSARSWQQKDKAQVDEILIEAIDGVVIGKYTAKQAADWAQAQIRGIK